MLLVFQAQKGTKETNNRFFFFFFNSKQFWRRNKSNNNHISNVSCVSTFHSGRRNQPVVVISLRGNDVRSIIFLTLFFSFAKEKLKLLHSNTDEYIDEQTWGQYQLGAPLVWRRYKAWQTLCATLKGSSRYFTWWRTTGLSWRRVITCASARAIASDSGTHAFDQKFTFCWCTQSSAHTRLLPSEFSRELCLRIAEPFDSNELRFLLTDGCCCCCWEKEKGQLTWNALSFDSAPILFSLPTSRPLALDKEMHPNWGGVWLLKKHNHHCSFYSLPFW